MSLTTLRVGAVRIVGAVALAAALIGCRSIPDVAGSRADRLAPGALVEAAEEAFAAGRHEEAAEAAEWFLKHHFDEPGVSRVRWVAAEARFARGEFADAIVHYRRLLDEDRFTRHAPAIAGRAFEIGRTLVRRPGRFFGDLGADHDAGVEALNLVVTHFPRDERADDAWKELAAVFADDGAFAAAADIYERLAREYPESEWRDLALFRVAEAYANQTRGGAFDVEPLLRADAALVRYLTLLPDGNFVEDAETLRVRLHDEVTRHELEVADHYRERGDADGERLHLTNAATRFPDAASAEEARERLALLEAEPGADSNDLLRPRSERPPWEQGPVPGRGAADRGAAGKPAAGR